MQSCSEGTPAVVERRAPEWQKRQSSLYWPAWILWLKAMGWLWGHEGGGRRGRASGRVSFRLQRQQFGGGPRRLPRGGRAHLRHRVFRNRPGLVAERRANVSQHGGDLVVRQLRAERRASRSRRSSPSPASGRSGRSAGCARGPRDPWPPTRSPPAAGTCPPSPRRPPGGRAGRWRDKCPRRPRVRPARRPPAPPRPPARAGALPA